MAKRETTSEWVAEQMTGALSAYPGEVVDRTLPVIVLFMAKEFGIENLESKVLARLDEILGSAGVTAETPAEEVGVRLNALVADLDPSVDLLEDVRAIFETHAAAVAEQSQSSFSSLLGRRRARTLPARHGDAKPKGALSLGDFHLPRRI